MRSDSGIGGKQGLSVWVSGVRSSAVVDGEHRDALLAFQANIIIDGDDWSVDMGSIGREPRRIRGNDPSVAAFLRHVLGGIVED